MQGGLIWNSTNRYVYTDELYGGNRLIQYQGNQDFNERAFGSLWMKCTEDVRGYDRTEKCADIPSSECKARKMCCIDIQDVVFRKTNNWIP